MQYDPSNLPPVPQRNIWKVSNTIVLPPIVGAHYQHVEHDLEDHGMTEPQRPEYPPKEVVFHKRRPTLAHELIQDVENMKNITCNLERNKIKIQEIKPYSNNTNINMENPQREKLPIIDLLL